MCNSTHQVSTHVLYTAQLIGAHGNAFTRHTAHGIINRTHAHPNAMPHKNTQTRNTHVIENYTGKEYDKKIPQ